jgi:mannonate dehydratase
VFDVVELLEPTREDWWAWLPQIGVRRVVGLLPEGEQKTRWLSSSGSGSMDWRGAPQTAPERGSRCWEFEGLRSLKRRYAESGLDLVALEDTPPMDLIRLNRPGRDEQLEWILDMIRAMGELDIRVLCYNWMAQRGWARTRFDVAIEGGALVSAFDVAEADHVLVDLPADPGSAEELWAGLAYFLDAVLPVAEESGVSLAMHPDDPPLPTVVGLPRIMYELQSYYRLLALSQSPANGVTLCQGNFALMTDRLPDVIDHLGSAIKFVHLRDVRGTRESFVETLHGAGPTNLAECMDAYYRAGFSGIMRPDHVPTLAGESNDRPGYAALGRLHAIGYIQGLREASYGKPSK